MSIAYWCILSAALLPYVWVIIAKKGATHADNRNPREWINQQTNLRVQYANAAQLNAYEIFAPFAASVLMAQMAGVTAWHVTWVAVLFVCLRVLHGVFYLAGLHKMRSFVWILSLLCIIVLMSKAAVRLAW